MRPHRGRIFILQIYFVLSIILALLLPIISYGQDFIYVNTDNLLLRDRPEKQYMVFAVLHAPCKLRIDNTDRFYRKNKAVMDKFYSVSYTYRDKSGRGHHTGGWVEKKYTVEHLSDITLPGADTTVSLSLTENVLIPYIGSDEDDPNEWNYTQYPYPKYKGGEHQFITKAAPRRAYHLGERGGCYYLGGTGKKVYVDKKYCESLKVKPHAKSKK